MYLVYQEKEGSSAVPEGASDKQADVSKAKTQTGKNKSPEKPERPKQGLGEMLGMFIPLIFFFIFMMYMSSRKQKRERKQHEDMVNTLRKGDKVVTIGGVHGSVVSSEKDAVVLRVGLVKDERMTFDKAAIRTVLGQDQDREAK